ncbi:MAG: extracellular solute-binding protein [Planctomycetota bacterium]
MNATRIIVVACMAILLGVPMLFRPESAAMPDDARRLIIITPHNEQIRQEFAEAFDAWHTEAYGERVEVIYNVPGGTSEIRKLLLAQFEADLRRGDDVGGNADLVFGGGSYEHGVLRDGVEVNVDGEIRSTSISAPVDFDDAWLDEIFGENKIADITLYDPEKHWFGVALSGFGIVYNRDILEVLDVTFPRAPGDDADPRAPLLWSDMCHPDMRRWLALVNPGQSGSVTTAFEAILKQKGWHDGWATLRRMGANARYFSATSSKPPTDVSQGDAAMGVAIDFYGRFQSQALLASIGDDRVGYVDPPGVSTIDPDPISMLRGAPNEEIAKRFIEFSLSDAGQALWQFRADDDSDDGLGPTEFELRRMPIRRSFYTTYLPRFVDQVNPFELAAPMRYPDRNFRAFIPSLFASMAMDNHELLKEAWTCIVEHDAYPHDHVGIVRAADVTDPVLREMLEAFDALPDVPTPDGERYSLDDVTLLGDIKKGWLRDGWAEHGLWAKEASPEDVLRRTFGTFFREQYQTIIDLAHAPAG